MRIYIGQSNNNSFVQDGFPTGTLVGLNVNATGTLVESFTMDFDDPFSYITTNTDSAGYYYVTVSGTYTGDGQNPHNRDAFFMFNSAGLSFSSVEWDMNGNPPPLQQPPIIYNPLHEYSFY